MEYSKLVAVTGLPGLFELINSKTDGAIVKSLDDKTTRFVASRIHNFSHLESIEVFTTSDNVNLIDIFHAMEKSDQSLPDTKNEDAVKKYFQKTYPDLDFERVYTSDLKKMVKWFDALKKNNVEIKLPEPPAEEPEEIVQEPPPKEIKADKPKTKEAAPPPPAKKSAPPDSKKIKEKQEPAKEEKSKKTTTPKTKEAPKKTSGSKDKKKGK